MPRNARFWVWHSDGWVKITLKPGQALAHHSYQPGDEGWSSETNQWIHEGSGVRLQWFMDGTDCDGRLTQSGELFCRLINLASVCMFDDDRDEQQKRDNAGIFVPDWQKVSSGQRDYNAEAAGY